MYIFSSHFRFAVIYMEDLFGYVVSARSPLGTENSRDVARYVSTELGQEKRFARKTNPCQSVKSVFESIIG